MKKDGVAKEELHGPRGICVDVASIHELRKIICVVSDIAKY